MLYSLDNVLCIHSLSVCNHYFRFVGSVCDSVSLSFAIIFEVEFFSELPHHHLPYMEIKFAVAIFTSSYICIGLRENLIHHIMLINNVTLMSECSFNLFSQCNMLAVFQNVYQLLPRNWFHSIPIQPVLKHGLATCNRIVRFLFFNYVQSIASLVKVQLTAYYPPLLQSR